MARERPTYRDELMVQIERINEKYPKKDFLIIKEVSEFMGWGHEKTKKIFPFVGNQISVVKLASILIK